jgi:hypothetical protein
MALPPVIAEAGEHAARMTLEFFTARIPNAHTRMAYGRAVFGFCERPGSRVSPCVSSTLRP